MANNVTELSFNLNLTLFRRIAKILELCKFNKSSTEEFLFSFVKWGSEVTERVKVTKLAHIRPRLYKMNKDSTSVVKKCTCSWEMCQKFLSGTVSSFLSFTVLFIYYYYFFSNQFITIYYCAFTLYWLNNSYSNIVSINKTLFRIHLLLWNKLNRQL